MKEKQVTDFSLQELLKELVEMGMNLPESKSQPQSQPLPQPEPEPAAFASQVQPQEIASQAAAPQAAAPQPDAPQPAETCSSETDDSPPPIPQAQLVKNKHICCLGHIKSTLFERTTLKRAILVSEILGRPRAFDL